MEKEPSEKPHECCMKKSEAGMFQRYGLVIMVAAVLLMSIVQTFQIYSYKDMVTSNQLTGNAVSGMDMSGWTENEKMMYEHHGTLPARAQSGGKPAGSGMVGGC